jgi:hypothetical protein
MKTEVNKLLATATPNPAYEYRQNFVGVTMEARLMGTQVRFFELNNGDVFPLTHETVGHMFKPDHLIVDQPYLIKDNRAFYDVLCHPQNYHQIKKEFHIYRNA